MRALLLTIILLVPAIATAQTCTTSWASAADGDWFDGANWTDGLPDADDTACITAAGTYTVTTDDGFALPLAGLVVGGASGTQTLRTNADIDVSGDARIAPNGRVETFNRGSSNADGLDVAGTLLVEGVLAHGALTRLMAAGGTLDIAPGGLLQYMEEQARAGSADALVRIRGTFDGSCGTSTCNLDASIDVRGGTIRVAEGRLDVAGGGTIDGVMLDAAAGATLFLRSGTAGNTFVVEGTVAGDPEGDVNWFQANVAAGPAGATLAMGGTGFRLAGSVTPSTFTSAGGAFTNTGLLYRPTGFVSDFSGIRDVEVFNRGRIEFRNGLDMRDGARLINEADGVLAFVGDGGSNVGSQGRIINRGLLLLDAEATRDATINVPVDVEGGTVRVAATQLLRLNVGGSFLDATLEVVEGGTLWTRGTWLLEGSLGGTVAGSASAFSAIFQAGPADAVLDVGGNGLDIGGGSGTLFRFESAGGEFVNRGRLVARPNGPRFGVGVFRNEGNFVVDGAGVTLETGSVLRNEPSGRIALERAGRFSGSGRLENAGLLETLQGEQAGEARSSLGGTLRSLPGSELRTGAGARLSLDVPASRTLPADVRATGDGEFFTSLALEIEGTVSPGTAAQPIDTLGVTSWLVFSRVAGSPQLVIDVDEGGVSDQIALARGTGPNFAARLAGTLVVRVRPGYTPQVGDAFEVIRITNSTSDQFQGTFARVVADGAPEGIAFVAEKNDGGTALLVRAVEVAADGPVTVSETDPIGGAIRPVFLSGPGVPGVTSARLECTTCLDPDGFGTIPADLVGAGTLKEARFDLTDPRAIGLYDLVLERPGLDPERVAMTVRPYVSVAPMLSFIERGIRVRPEGGGFNPSSAKIYSFAGDLGPTYPFTRVYRPAPEVTALSLSASNPFSGSPQFFNDDARDEPEGPPILFLRVAAEAFTYLSVNLRMDPSAVLFPEQTATGPDDPRYPFGEDIPGFIATLPNVSFERAARIIEEGLRGTNLPALQSYLASVDDLDDGLLRRSIGTAIVQRGRSYIGRPLALIDQVIDVLDEEVTAPNGLAEAAARPFEEALDLALGAFSIAQDLAHGEALVDGPPEVRALLEAERDALVARIDAELGVDDTATAPAPASTVFNSDVSSERHVGGRGWDPSVPVPTGPFCKSKLSRGVKAAYSDPFSGAAAIYGGGDGGGGSSSSGGDSCSPPSGSADPNDKLAQSDYVCEFGTVVVDGEEVTRCVRYFVPLAEATAPIDYGITFENLAIATEAAEFVTITDTLDANLDPNTLEVLGTSADSTFSYTVDGQVVTFRFVGIDLPPNVSPPEGEGFVRFAVQPRSGLDEGTVIDNDASIVFDFNPPIETPVVRHQLRAVADLAVEVRAPTEGIAGEAITYVVQVANTQGDEAGETRVVITLPDAPLTSVTSPLGECTGSGPVVCDLGALPQTDDPEDAVHIEVVMQAEARGTLQLTASATTTSFDGFLPNNNAAASTEVVVVGTEDEAGLPTEFTLDSVFPNPFTSGTSVRYGLPEAARVEMVVYDLLGRRVKVLADADQPAGWHEAAWDATRLASGVYICQFRAGGVVQTQKVTLVR